MTSTLWNVTGLAVSPNGNILAVATRDGLSLYDSETLQLGINLENDMNWSNSGNISISWSPSGDRLAVARYTSTLSGEPDPQSGIQIWEIAAATFHLLAGEPLAISWSQSNGLIASVDVNGVYALWDDTRNLSVSVQSDLSSQIGLIDVLAWSTDGTKIAGVNETVSPVVLWDYENSGEPHVIELSGSVGGYFTWSPSSQHIAVGDWASSFIWIVETDTERVIRILEGSKGNPFDVQWSPDGSRLARGTQNGLYLWDMTSNDTEPFRAFEENVPPFVRIAWLPDSQHLISVDFEGSIYRWDIETGCVEVAVLKEWQP
jgi:WD40 repeat protein